MLYVVFTELHARSPTWWNDGKTSIEGAQLDAISSIYGFHQLITEPTHLMEQSASCIDLIFTNQLNFIIDSGVHPSIHTNCHHQTVYCKLNLNIKFPPPFERLFWNYNKGDIDKIKKSLKRLIRKTCSIRKKIRQQLSVLNKT